jgi:aspartyl protease family protein
MAGRLAGELLPGSAMVVEESPGGPVEVKIRKRLDGHFTAKAEVNGTSISMIVDTGASTIVLRPEDAKKVGIDVSKLSYTVPVLTANGARSPRACGSAEVLWVHFSEDVDALVVAERLTDSLLGMALGACVLRILQRSCGSAAETRWLSRVHENLTLLSAVVKYEIA